jgi:hypothetical protein
MFRDGRRGRDRLAGILCERRLGIEQIDMAGRTFHEAPDDGFGARRNVRFFGSERIGGSSAVAFLIEHGGQRDGGKAAAGLSEKLAAAANVPMMFELV